MSARGIVLTFGAFDPLHDGHRDLFRQAKKFGRKLVVVVARDSVIKGQKKRDPRLGEVDRLRKVAAEKEVSEARLGEEYPAINDHRLLAELNFDILALGYDQEPSDSEVDELMLKLKPGARWVRLKAFKPERYKSSLLAKPS